MTSFAAAVLCGGASSRMGQDKALLEVDGRPMAIAAADALHAAGATDVVAVGGALETLEAAGLDGIPDEHPGDGPLAAIVTALHWSREPITVVVACDLLTPTAAAIIAVVDALAASPDALVAVPLAGGFRQPLHGAYRGAAAVPLERAFAAGERAIHRALASLEVVEVEGLDPTALADADSPGDLPPVR